MTVDRQPNGCAVSARAFPFTRLLFTGLGLCLAAACGGELAAPSSDPAALVARAGGRGEVEGEVEVLVEDHAEHARTRHFLKTDGGPIELRLPGAAPRELRPGARVRARGVLSERILALDPTGAVTTLAPAAATLAGSLGEQRTLVVLVNFRDKPAEQPWTVEQVRGAILGTASAYFREASYGRTWLAGDVRGWYTIGVDSTTCDQLGIAASAKQAAASAGADLSAYSRLVYAFPPSSCGWAGTGSVGGNPSQTWLNGRIDLAVAGHELGHNLGLEHSHSLVCSGATLGTGCTTLEYGDGVDLMGWSSAAHFHAFQKERLGWLNDGVAPPVTTVLASGDYVIDRYEPPGTSPKALKILESTDPATGLRTWYYVEYRQAIGFDAVFASGGSLMDGANVLGGVVVHTGSEDNGGYDNFLLDLTPATYQLYTRDPALTVGASFSDPAAGVTLTTLWANGTNAGVRVSLASGSGCTRANPGLSLSPSSQSAPAGASLSYRLDLANRDGAGCPSSTFDLRAAAPSGWAAALASPALALAPGASGSTTLTVTSPASAASATYSAQVTATDAASPAHSASGSALYAVSAPAALAVAVSTDALAYRKGARVAMTATVTSAGLPLSGATVTFHVTKPNGSAVTQAASTGSAGQALSTLRLSSKDPPGTYQVRASATSGGQAASGTTSFVVR